MTYINGVAAKHFQSTYNCDVEGTLRAVEDLDLGIAQVGELVSIMLLLSEEGQTNSDIMHALMRSTIAFLATMDQAVDAVFGFASHHRNLIEAHKS